jgi:hypothetical protein
MDGKIDATNSGEMRRELEVERHAATAESERLAEQRVEVESCGQLQDTEAETLRLL